MLVIVGMEHWVVYFILFVFIYFCVFVALNISNINNDFSYPFFMFYPLLQMHFTITPFDTRTTTSSNITNDIIFMIMAVLCCVYFLSEKKTPFSFDKIPAKIKTLLSHIIICISWLSKNIYKYLTP